MTMIRIGSEMTRLFSAVRQHRHHTFEVIFGNEHVDIELTFPLRRLFRQDVPRMRMTAFDLARGGRAKALRGAFMCFQFWHYSSIKWWLVAGGWWLASICQPPTTNYQLPTYF